MDNIATKDSRVYCTQGPDKLTATSEGVLSGLRFVFKDLFDVQGYVTGAGNPAWLTSHKNAEQSSSLIDALLSNGATCVGRVQTDELAYSLNGQNIHYGTPVNPVASECLPGGSAVAVANDEADFSIGTDTGGSVRVPASYCGLFGLRPTLGKLNLDNCFQLSKSFDTAGIFTRDLTLMSSVFSVLAADLQQGNVAKNIYLDKHLAKQLSNQRIRTLETWCKKANITLLPCDVLSEIGYSLDDLSLLFRTIQGFEIIKEHDDWLQKYGHTLDPSIMERVVWSRTITTATYQEAKNQQTSFKNKLTNLFNKLNGLWVLPTTPSGPPDLTLTGDRLALYRSQLMGLTSIAGLSGFPQLHLAMRHLSEGPCGFSLMGVEDTETDLIATGQALWQEEEQK